MATIRRRYWVGSEGPYLQVVDTENPVAPFRYEALEDAVERNSQGTIGNITVRRGESGREETPVTSRRVGGRVTGITKHDPITAGQYVAYRGAHAHSFDEVLIGSK